MMWHKQRPMSDNESMNEQHTPPVVEEDATAIDALRSADPADSPDLADGLAAGLQRELDQTAAPEDTISGNDL